MCDTVENAVARWNRDNPVGTFVFVDDRNVATRTTSPAWSLEDDTTGDRFAVVWAEGVYEPLALDRVRVAPVFEDSPPRRAPATPDIGSIWLDTDFDPPMRKRFDGSDWRPIATVRIPADSLRVRTGDALPAGCIARGLSPAAVFAGWRRHPYDASSILADFYDAGQNGDVAIESAVSNSGHEFPNEMMRHYPDLPTLPASLLVNVSTTHGTMRAPVSEIRAILDESRDAAEPWRSGARLAFKRGHVRRIKTRTGATKLWRFWIEGQPGVFSRSVLLHWHLNADDDIDPHDHPCTVAVRIMAGGYVEARGAERDSVFREPGDEFIIAPNDVHRIVAVQNSGAWSLVKTGPFEREWGYHTAGGFVSWRDYHQDEVDG